MGYTHYLYLNSNGPQELWSEAVMAARQIIEASPVPLADGHGEGNGPLYCDDGIYTNGVGEDSHETLFVPATLAQLLRYGECYGRSTRFVFCKTAWKPYDVVVTAVYAALREIAGPECVTVHSDGDAEDWQDGCELARRVLGHDVPVPLAADGVAQ